jgi:hypothetical protein
MRRRVIKVAGDLLHLASLCRHNDSSALASTLEWHARSLEEAVGDEFDPKADEEFVGMSELQLKDKLLRIQTAVEDIEKLAGKIARLSLDESAVGRASLIGDKCWEIYHVTGIEPKKSSNKQTEEKMGSKLNFKTKQEKTNYVIRKMARFLWQAYGTEQYKSLLSKEAEETLLNLFDLARDIIEEDPLKE